LVPRLRLARIAALPNRAHGETWRRIADVERVVEILHVTSSIRESSSGLAEVLVFSSELPPSLVVSLVVGERWGGGGEKAVAAQ
jgi:hypothetical protein